MIEIRGSGINSESEQQKLNSELDKGLVEIKYQGFRVKKNQFQILAQLLIKSR